MGVDVDKIRRIADDLEKAKGQRGMSRLSLTVAAMLASMIPIAGGPASIALDKLSGSLFSPDVEGILAALVDELLSLAPQIEAIEPLDARVQALADLVSQNDHALRLLVDAASATASGLDALTVNNVGGTQRFKNVIVEQMHLLSTAASGAVTSYNDVKVSGPARFDTDHAEQNITDSHFVGRTGGFTSAAYFQNATFGQGTVEHHVVEPGKFIDLRVTRVVGPNDPGGSALKVSTTIGPKRL